MKVRINRGHLNASHARGRHHRQMARGRSCLMSNGLGLSFDRELMEPDERRLRVAAPSGGGRRPRLLGHPPVRNLARTDNFSYSTISRWAVWPITIIVAGQARAFHLGFIEHAAPTLRPVDDDFTKSCIPFPEYEIIRL